MATFQVLLTQTNQSFTLDIGDKTYTFFVRYRNADEAGWTMDIQNPDGTMLIAGIPFVTGCDLLAQYAYLGLDIQFIVATDGAVDAVPTFTNLGKESKLYMVTAT